ncbi:MAG: glycerol-3-phosphate acyltransferase [Clostridia bacterium]|nr:glycerol-3-phosphate acyltransferase [Clostridia bacterium]
MKDFSMSQYWWCFVIAAVVCYFIGCFNFAVLISHFKKKDIRNIGSGNPGTMNMMRSFGLKIGILNFLCDALKGGLPVLIAYFIFKDYCFAGTNVCVADFARYFCGMFVVIGHIFPVTMKFKGGKGIASTLGLFWFSLACEKWWFIFIGLGLLVLVLVYIALYEWGSMGSLLGVSVFSIWQAVIFYLRYAEALAQGYVIACFMLLIAINLLTWIAHHKNIYKLLGGEEHRTSIKKMINKKIKKSKQ